MAEAKVENGEPAAAVACVGIKKGFILFFIFY